MRRVQHWHPLHIVLYTDKSLDFTSLSKLSQGLVYPWVNWTAVSLLLTLNLTLILQHSIARWRYTVARKEWGPLFFSSLDNLHVFFFPLEPSALAPPLCPSTGLIVCSVPWVFLWHWHNGSCSTEMSSSVVCKTHKKEEDQRTAPCHWLPSLLLECHWDSGPILHAFTWQHTSSCTKATGLLGASSSSYLSEQLRVLKHAYFIVLRSLENVEGSVIFVCF